MKRVLVFLLLFLPCLTFAQAHFNGTVLILSNGSKISVGSQVRVLKPSKGSRFSFIYSELALRASSEEDLPYGVSSSLSNQEVTVKRFLERKGNGGTKYYLICSGSFIKNAIDIENALKAGEVSVVNSAGNLSTRPSLALSPSGQTAAPAAPFGRASVAGPILNTPAAAAGARLIRRPWDPLVIPVSKDSLGAKDSSKRFAKGFKTVDSMNTAAGKGLTVKADSNLRITKAKDSSSSFAREKKTTDPLINASARARRAEIRPEENAAETVTSPPDSEHSVSALMTLPSAESLKPKEVSAKSVLTETSPGYTKFAKLKQLKELLDSGVLTKAEFEAEKKKILLSE